MADVHKKEIRSFNMSRIRSKDTRPELLVRRFLHSKGFRYRLHSKHLPGRPDIVLPRYKAAIFVHGCFWHSHGGCKTAHIPSSNQDYWINKLNRNMARDAEHQQKLQALGWRVLIVWECELKKPCAQATLEKLSVKLRETD